MTHRADHHRAQDNLLAAKLDITSIEDAEAAARAMTTDPA